MSNVVELKPYEFHAWTVAKNRLAELILGHVHDAKKREVDRILDSFFTSCVKEIGNTHTLSREAMEHYKGGDLVAMEQHRTLTMLAEKIMELKLYSTRTTQSYFERETKTRVLVLDLHSIKELKDRG